jgi:hypothetical protein
VSSASKNESGAGWDAALATSEAQAQAEQQTARRTGTESSIAAGLSGLVGVGTKAAGFFKQPGPQRPTATPGAGVSPIIDEVG